MPPAYLKTPPVPPTIGVPFWCEGKVPFESALLAFEVAKRNPDKGPRHVYRCVTCGAFHVGTERSQQRTTTRAAVADLIRRR